MTSNRLDVVFVFLDNGDKNLYQVRQWIQPLQRLAAHRDVTVLYVSDDVTPLLADSGLGAAQVQLPEGLVEFLNARKPKLLLYPNQNVRNFYALRYGEGIHAWVSHGESEKAYMVQNTLRRYDLYFAAGQAAQERASKHIGDFKPERIRLIGRPQSGDRHPVPDSFVPSTDATAKVFYAPTWEGVTGATRYTSIESHGLRLVESLIERGYQVVYRPHPLSGSRDQGIARADRAIRRLLQKANEKTSKDTTNQSQHYVDTTEFGWQLAALDVMITDVSAVAYDWLATGKPLIVTQPSDERAVVIDSPLFNRTPRLAVSDVADVGTLIAGLRSQKEQALADYYFAGSSQSDELFLVAVDEAIKMADALPELPPLELFLPRGKRLGWLRYPNFGIRILAKSLGLWSTVSKKTPTFKSDVLYTHFSDPFDTVSVKAWLPEIADHLNRGRVVLATNQITTKLLLQRAFGRRNKNLVVLACSSTADSEKLIETLEPKELRYLKDHPTNLAALRANGVDHVLYRPEVDPNFAPTHSLIMYNEIRTSSAELTDFVNRILKVSTPKIGSPLDSR